MLDIIIFIRLTKEITGIMTTMFYMNETSKKQILTESDAAM